MNQSQDIESGKLEGSVSSALDRRDFLSRSALPAIAIAAVVGARPAVAAVSQAEVEIRSPDDCFITRLSVTFGSVKAGESLVTFYSPELERLRERLETFSESMAIQRRKFEDGRREELKKLQTEAVTKLVEGAELAERDYRIAKALFDAGVGLNPGVELGNAHLRLSGAQLDLSKQQLKLRQFDRDTSDLIDRLNMIQRHLGNERQRLKDVSDRLTVQAPYDGTFTAHCAVGLFLKKGQRAGSLVRRGGPSRG